MQIKTHIYQIIKDVLLQARNNTYSFVNAQMVNAYWQIGKIIVDEEQQGETRATYGSKLLKEIAQKLTLDFGKGFDERELRRIRQFYLCFPIRDSLRPELTWTHYRLIIRVENKDARKYYINETISQHWSTRKLDRNISTQYFQRIIVNQSQNFESVAPGDFNPNLNFIKDPYVLEFLNLPNNLNQKEKDIENAIITHIKSFLLELGKGFAFVAQQKLIRTETSDFYIDLVFYNYILKCFVVIDIKNDKLSHQDVGQLDMYVRMFDDLEKSENDNPTIGILLCADMDNVVAKYSVLNDKNNLFASKYLLYLPKEQELKQIIQAEIHKETEKLDNHTEE